MFQSLHSAARRMAGTISAISEDDSSESDCDSKTQQQNPSVAVTPASTSTAQAEKVSEFQAMKKSLSSLPRVQLLGMLFRTSESIRHLHEILCEEFHRQTSLEDENKSVVNSNLHLIHFIYLSLCPNVLSPKFLPHVRCNEITPVLQVVKRSHRSIGSADDANCSIQSTRS